MGIMSMVEYDGKLILGGWYSNFNGHQRRNLQAWDGDLHNDLPGAFEDGYHRVNSLTIFENDLIAAGLEPSYDNIARWDGDQWSSIGTGFTSEVRDIQVVNGTLHAVAQDSAVHRWNGSEWEPLGPGFNGHVLAIVEHNGILYAGDQIGRRIGSLRLRSR